MNKADFTFFHLKRTQTFGAKLVGSMFLFLSLFFSVNMSAQTAACNGNLNISVDPGTCTAIISADAVGSISPAGPAVVTILGVPRVALTNDSTDMVTIDVTLIPAFLASGMVMDLTYNLYAGADVESASNSCWGTFLLEDKAPPVAMCSDTITIACDLFDGTQFVTPTTMGMMPTVLECTAITIDSTDRWSYDQCVADTLFRTYRIRDVKGNTTSCIQAVELTPEPLADLTLPPFFDGIGDRTITLTLPAPDGPTDFAISDEGMILCSSLDSFNLLANGNPSPDGPLPSVGDGSELFGTGRPGGVTCGTINAEFEDLKINVCQVDCDQFNPSFKVLREWTIFDWCTSTVLEYNQIIKIADTLAPVITALPDVTISTDLWGCGASYRLPAGTATDNCTSTSAIIVTYGSSVGTVISGNLILPSVAKTMPGEEVEVYVNYSDCCGNTSTDTFLVSVADMVPPVVVADHHTVVSLSQYNENGLAKVFAHTFDDGSFDGCGPIGFSVRRMTTNCSGDLPGEGDIPGDDDDLENEDGTDDHDMPGDEMGTGADNLWFDYIHFCCEDVTESPIMVVFRVCDDANMDGAIGTPVLDAGNNPVGPQDYCNTAMVEVTVQDKLPPACSIPGPATINCIDLVAIQDLVGSGPLSEEDVTRVEALFGASLGAATCNVAQTVTLFGDETCGAGTITRRVVVVNTVNDKDATCEQTITVIVEDENILGCEDIVFPSDTPEGSLFNGIANLGYVWCYVNNDDINDADDDFDGYDFPPIVVNSCGEATITPPEINIDNLCSEVGINLTLDTFNFNSGGCIKILAHWEVIDQCIFDENFLYNAGTVANPQYEINPFVAENGYFEIYVEYDIFDTEGPIIVCGDGLIVGCGEDLTGELTASATDLCTTDPTIFGWSWRLDLDADGDFDAEGNGQVVEPGDVVIGGVALTTFPEGNHSITWIVSDGCGNISSLDCPFGTQIVDEKAPTPYCYDGLATAVMLENGVTLWAADFDAGSFDACSDVTVYIVPEQDVIEDNLDNAGAFAAAKGSVVLNVTTGLMEFGWNFTCKYIPNGVASTIDVRLYAEDAAGNYDYCTASLRLQDNLDGCEDVGGFANIAGVVSTEGTNAVDNVLVEAMADNPEFPKFANTDADGNYSFASNPLGYGYELSATRDDNHMNGVSTLDLVIIQKHILDIESLDSPYKRIAADINNDSSIKVNDLLQLRKLILGLYDGDALPSNEAWRFVDADFQFADATNPFPFDEVVNIVSLDIAEMAENFVAVKVGDVNGNVQLNGKGDATVRSNKAVTFDLNNKDFAAGEIVELEFTSADFNEVFGYQFTLEFAKGLSFNDIVPGALNVTEANFGLNRISEGVITTSFDAVRGATASSDEVLFTVKFVANNAGSLSDMVSVTSANTAAEAYVGNSLEVVNVNATFRTNENAATYTLYQNEPNPFKDATVVKFELPEAATATLKVYDVTGKVLYNKVLDAKSGLNTHTVRGLDASGVMYYQLDSDDFTATKKMIVIK